MLMGLVVDNQPTTLDILSFIFTVLTAVAGVIIAFFLYRLNRRSHRSTYLEEPQVQAEADYCGANTVFLVDETRDVRLPVPHGAIELKLLIINPAKVPLVVQKVWLDLRQMGVSDYTPHTIPPDRPPRSAYIMTFPWVIKSDDFNIYRILAVSNGVPITQQGSFRVGVEYLHHKHSYSETETGEWEIKYSADLQVGTTCKLEKRYKGITTDT